MASECGFNVVEGCRGFNEPETPEKMKQVARKELGETEELRTKCLQQMRAMIRENNLATLTTDDFLLRFLRTKKFRIQKSFETIQNYSNMRASFHDRLVKLRPEVLEKCLRRSMLGFFPYRDGDERITLYFDTGSWNPSICSDEELAMIITVLINYVGEKKSSQITGFNVFFETKVVPVRQIPYLMRHIAFLLKFALNALPARYRYIHFINEPFLVKCILQALDPLLPKKIKERLVFHGKTREALLKQFPAATLPDCFGGKRGPLNNDHLIDPILDHFRQMKEENKQVFCQNVGKKVVQGRS